MNASRGAHCQRPRRRSHPARASPPSCSLTRRLRLPVRAQAAQPRAPGPGEGRPRRREPAPPPRHDRSTSRAAPSSGASTRSGAPRLGGKPSPALQLSAQSSGSTSTSATPSGRAAARGPGPPRGGRPHRSTSSQADLSAAARVSRGRARRRTRAAPTSSACGMTPARSRPTSSGRAPTPEWRRREARAEPGASGQELIAARDVDQARASSRPRRGGSSRWPRPRSASTRDQVRAAPKSQLEADHRRPSRPPEALVRQREAAVELGRKRLTDTVVPARSRGRGQASRLVGEFVKDNTRSSRWSPPTP